MSNKIRYKTKALIILTNSGYRHPMFGKHFLRRLKKIGIILGTVIKV